MRKRRRSLRRDRNLAQVLHSCDGFGRLKIGLHIGVIRHYPSGSRDLIRAFGEVKQMLETYVLEVSNGLLKSLKHCELINRSTLYFSADCTTKAEVADLTVPDVVRVSTRPRGTIIARHGA